MVSSRYKAQGRPQPTASRQPTTAAARSKAKRDSTSNASTIKPKSKSRNGNEKGEGQQDKRNQNREGQQAEGKEEGRITRPLLLIGKLNSDSKRQRRPRHNAAAPLHAVTVWHGIMLIITRNDSPPPRFPVGKTHSLCAHDASTHSTILVFNINRGIETGLMNDISEPL